MLIPGTGWVEASIRTLQTTRDVGWWMRLSVQNAVADAVAEEANRLSQQVASFSGPANGTLRATLGAAVSADAVSGQPGEYAPRPAVRVHNAQQEELRGYGARSLRRLTGVAGSRPAGSTGTAR